MKSPNTEGPSRERIIFKRLRRARGAGRNQESVGEQQTQGGWV